MQTNKQDFEEALGRMEHQLTELEGIITSDIWLVFDEVSGEYNYHFKGVIESAMEDIGELKDKVSELEEDKQELTSQNSEMRNRIIELTGEGF